ncbi:alpha-1,4-glucan--maltose-1-phosphate maltosyltransferase [Puniceicoccales bacterium CK1056]|uniref:Alpha-1,4-glucan:maltose-1-phosphate maltosyltransferase n=1 Tax=Oceanipulchritudo coccoides TaxID=2706888 RepID=A0A6B2M3C6_9BACT|nr:alpha-1,4-glucan--maltose-1-phosphate maltosyltransferase [Oceanipulchritudo coccoides]NDV62587.1 alpha-1,4-glucan--maltose-1-phosphate maltosyltransferase [Oceanipulchritudo coccoides]
MTPVSKFPGPSRVVIDHVTPSIGGGMFPVKRPLGDDFHVEAHVIADGHDHLDVVLAYRKIGQKRWEEVPMQDLGNDEFGGTFRAEQIGLHEYRVIGWADEFRNWHVGFVKKSDAGDSKIGVELDIGARLVAEAASRAKGKDAKQLKGWAGFLGDHSRDLMQKVNLARQGDFFETVRRYPDRSLQTQGTVSHLLVEREKAYFSTWYEFFPRSCANDASRHGTFKDAISRFPEIARMGFDVVYFPPIHPIGEKFRKGRNNALEAAPEDVGSPWAIGSSQGGHKSLHPELGSMEDFKDLIEAADKHGLEVALDIAFQCAPDHPYVKEHPQWFKWRPDGTVQYAENPPKKYQDILPFDFETEDWKALWLELKSIFDFWIEAEVKIFRVDNPHTKPMEFWRWCIGELKVTHPEVLFLAEAFTRPKRKYRLAKAGFTQGYTYFTWRNFPQEVREYVEELTQSEVKEFFLPNFWPNTPDILHEDLQKGNRATFLGRYILAATLSSNIGIYGPAFELMEKEPFPGKEEYNHNEKYELKNWNWDRPGNLKNDISRVNGIRRDHPAMHRTANIRFVDTDNASILAYIKQTPDRKDQLLVIVNFDWHKQQEGNVHLPLSEMGIGSDKAFEVKDLFDPTQPAYMWRGSRNFFSLNPIKSPAHIFQINLG